jgi:type IV secretory pathway VirJ component
MNIVGKACCLLAAGLAGVAAHAAPQSASGVGDLPLIEIPAAGGTSDVLAILLSGDGGWAGLAKEVAAALQSRGVAVVGLDSLRYFWSERTPEEAAHDLGRVIDHYAQQWHRSRVLLIGYSQGADVLPFMVNRLPADVHRRIAGMALVGLGSEAFFEFHLSHWLGTPTGGLPVRPEIARQRIGRVLCIHGTGEDDSPCPTLQGEGLRSVELPGGHHFDGDYGQVAEAITTGLLP